MPHNDRGYAHLRFAGASLSQNEKVNAGAISIAIGTDKYTSASQCS